MPIEFKMPEIAESIVEGEIGKWFVREGDFVKKDQILLEVLTEKVNVEVPSPLEGRLVKFLYPEGAVVKVGTPIALFETEEEEKREKEEAREAPAPTREEMKEERAGEEILPSRAEEKVLAAPAVRAYAREKGVDLTKVKGTGPGGRITKEDVERFLVESKRAPAVPAITPAGEVEKIPYRGKRRMVGDHMRLSLDRAAHTLVVEEVDVTNLVSLRERMKPLAEKEGVKLTYLSFITKALIPALQSYPAMNASLDEEKGELLLKKYYNIGIAVDVEDGLIVPVVKQVDKKPVFQIAREIEALAEKARKGTLSLEEVQDATFSITSAGHIGVFLSAPIIHYPNSAILGVHQIKKRPVVMENQIVIRDVIYLSISFDHRIVDGATVARFLQALAGTLQTPELLLIESIGS